MRKNAHFCQSGASFLLPDGTQDVGGGEDFVGAGPRYGRRQGGRRCGLGFEAHNLIERRAVGDESGGEEFRKRVQDNERSLHAGVG